MDDFITMLHLCSTSLYLFYFVLFIIGYYLLSNLSYNNKPISPLWDQLKFYSILILILFLIQHIYQLIHL